MCYGPRPLPCRTGPWSYGAAWGCGGFVVRRERVRVSPHRTTTPVLRGEGTSSQAYPSRSPGRLVGRVLVADLIGHWPGSRTSVPRSHRIQYGLQLP